MIFQSTVMITPIMIGIIIALLIFWIIAIGLAVWVYRDAKKREMDAAVWLLIVLLSGCIGFIIYLKVRE
ncbi:hypothetical protein LCGC14_2631060 [marine sediment metagenome]|uniref:Cardiolipin synthase N-terminal domain-containing protein n=1 Tax=marine sediment metagenome TaxID=412755 RepID=A0A0F9CSQ5_9ZZZZ